MAENKRNTVKFTKTSFILFLLLIVVFSSWLRIRHILNNPVMVHDEAISYLAATANQGEYHDAIENKTFPYGEWATVKDWQEFLKSDGKLAFSKIQNDLAAYDVHPPLYFWLLHLWVLIFGVNFWTGPLLNVFLSALNIVLLAFLARNIMNCDFRALAVAITYAFSPGVMSTTFLARNYELFSFFSILFLWGLRRLFVKDADALFLTGSILTVIVFLGLLTHYYFGLFAAAAFLAYFVWGIRQQENFNLFFKKLLTLGTSSAVGLLLMLMAHSEFFHQFFSFQSQGQPFSGFDLVLRILKVCLGISGYFVEVHRRGAPETSWLLLIILGVIVSTALIKPLRRRLFPQNQPVLMNSQITFLLIYLTLVIGIMVTLYLTFFTHQAVMGPRYLSPVFPVLSFFPVLFFRLWGRKETIGIIAFVCLMLISGTLYARPWFQLNAEKQAEISRADTILVDNVSRGILPIFMMYLPADKLVFAAMQDDLLDNKKWISGLKHRVLFLSALEYGNTASKRIALIEGIQDEYEAILVPGGQWGLYGLGQAYAFRRKGDNP
ncbi:MAG: glycosyltransferase family 39 protein [Thermodesulfobacteriota bacterium]|nr:glycosyltransferase family 39 protein [Thermodesulfobacteriota bacterium]